MKAAWLFVALTILTFSNTYGYDTGHHNDLTRNALQIFEYSASAQKVVPLANWFTDYFSYTFDLQEKLPPLNLLHFDNLYTLENVSYYFSQLAINTKKAIQEATTQNSPLNYLMLLGSSMHAVQDFYTHSSWVALHPQLNCDCFRSETFFSLLAAAGGNVTQLVPTHLALATYSYGDCDPPNQLNCRKGTIPHGDYCEGINKDSYVRPFWEQSYAFAFAASVEWLFNVEKWASEVNGSFVASARNYQPTTAEDREDLEEDYLASYVISYAVKSLISENGHWKGPGSGSVSRLATSFAEFAGSKSIFKSAFVDEKIHEKLCLQPHVYDAPDARGQTISPAFSIFTPFSSLEAGLTDYIAVKVRTTVVHVEKEINTPSPYAIVTIQGMDFTETIQSDTTDFNPHWTSLKFLPSTLQQISINYALFDDEFPSDDDVIRIAEGKDSLDFVLDTTSGALSGDISGTFNSHANAFTTESGDNSVSLFVSTRRMNAPGVGCTGASPFPVPFCEEEAYTALGIHEICARLDNEQ